MTTPIRYSHNLNIGITNQHGTYDAFNPPHIMEKIYEEITKRRTIQKTYDNNILAVDLCWKKVAISSLDKRFMGELFIVSPYSDMVLYDSTKTLLEEIEKSIFPDGFMRIAFHISKLLENRQTDDRYKVSIR